MKCKNCNSETKVDDSRVTTKGATIRRRRSCPKCGDKFTTFEYRDSNEVQDKLTLAESYLNMLKFSIEDIKLKMLKATCDKQYKAGEVWKI